jgi:hypothetical protein
MALETIQETNEVDQTYFERFDAYIASLTFGRPHEELNIEYTQYKSVIYQRYLQSKVHENKLFILNNMVDKVFATIKYLELMERNYWFLQLQRTIGKQLMPCFEDVENVYRMLFQSKLEYYDIANLKSGFVEVNEKWRVLNCSIEHRMAEAYKMFVRIFRIHTAHKINAVKKINCKCGRFVGFSDIPQKEFCLAEAIDLHRKNNTASQSKGLCPDCNNIEQGVYDFHMNYGMCEKALKCAVCIETVSALQSINTQLLMWSFINSHLLVLEDVWKDYGDKKASINIVECIKRGLINSTRFRDIHIIQMNDYYFKDCENVREIQQVTAINYPEILRCKALELERKKKIKAV